jgi:hypothetical protein
MFGFTLSTHSKARIWQVQPNLQRGAIVLIPVFRLQQATKLQMKSLICYDRRNFCPSGCAFLYRDSFITSEIQRQTPPGEIATTLDTLSTNLSTYLDYLGLPTDSVLVGISERRKVLNNMPDIMPALTESQRSSAMYISKFSAACVVGLFDAALNSLWDETIGNFRVKVVQFDLDYFYDTAINDANQRSKFRNESDLDKLDDWVLVKGCRETGIITDIGYRHLDYSNPKLDVNTHLVKYKRHN